MGRLKLHRWAGSDASRRFDDLFNLVYDPAFLVHAYGRVAGNTGARTAGVDRATVARIETGIGVEAFLDSIRTSLKSGGFVPVEVRQVMIPKAGGKLRKLGIPTVADRVVPASLKAVLEPIFEADFLRAAVLGQGLRLSKGLRVDLVIYRANRPDAMDSLVRLLGQGSVKPVIDRSFPLTEGRDAMAHYLSGAFTGMVVTRCGVTPWRENVILAANLPRSRTSDWPVASCGPG